MSTGYIVTNEILNSQRYRHEGETNTYCTPFFLCSGFVPLSFPDKVFNETAYYACKE